MKTLGIIFPNQLFHKVPISKHCETIAFVEYSLFFGEKKYISNFHQNKIVLHRASMKSYFENHLDKYNSHYIEYVEGGLEKVGENFSHLRKIFAFHPKDFLIEKRLKRFCQSRGIELEFIENPNFITPEKIYREFFQSTKFQMTPFYISQRKRLGILLDSHGKPSHGKWTFDTENRKKLPKNLGVPTPKFFGNSPYVLEAKKYTHKHFSNNLGHFNNFIFPVNTSEAKVLLHDFLENKLANFGPYEDAISTSQRFVYHSLLSSSINLGLLNPNEVLEETLEYYAKHHQHIPFSSIEGFIRQIIGWREFMMIVYELSGVRIRNSNFFNHESRLPQSFYLGETGILPFDETIKNVLNLSYAHHIERLMILGNFMCLCEIHPDDVYRWFMENFIDAYDWVMVPNVYGMSQYADGGLMTTKPYISSSNYILKMSDYPKGDWVEVWDGLFWRFLHKNYAKIAHNPRLSLLIKSNSFDKVKSKIKIGENFLKKTF